MSQAFARILRLLALLQAHGQLSGPDLAMRLGSDARSLRRDIQRLQVMGIPVEAERGPHGGYRLAPGFQLPPLMLSDDEGMAVALGLMAAQALGLVASTAASESANAKLMRAMPDALQAKLQALRGSVLLDISAAKPVPAQGALLLTLGQAIQTHQRLQLSYSARLNPTTQRFVDPYGLAFRQGHWYLVGHCHLRRAMRTFRLDRVAELEVTDHIFTPVPNVDAMQHLTHGIASLPRAYQVEVLLDCDLPTAQAAVFDSFGLLVPDAQGVRLIGQTDSLNWFARELARLPFGFKVLASDALRAEVRQLAQGLMRMCQ